MDVKQNNHKKYIFIPFVLRFIIFIVSLLWIPFVTVLTIRNNCSNEMIIFSVLSTVVIILLKILCDRYGMIISEEKIVVYEIRKRVFKNELIEYAKLDEFGTIILKYDGKEYKIRGIVSLITQDSNSKKNQEIVDIINKNINKEYSPDVLLDKISNDKDLNLF